MLKSNVTHMNFYETIGKKDETEYKKYVTYSKIFVTEVKNSLTKVLLSHCDIVTEKKNPVTLNFLTEAKKETLLQNYLILKRFFMAVTRKLALVTKPFKAEETKRTLKHISAGAQY